MDDLPTMLRLAERRYAVFVCVAIVSLIAAVGVPLVLLRFLKDQNLPDWVGFIVFFSFLVFWFAATAARARRAASAIADQMRAAGRP